MTNDHTAALLREEFGFGEWTRHEPASPEYKELARKHIGKGTIAGSLITHAVHRITAPIYSYDVVADSPAEREIITAKADRMNNVASKLFSVNTNGYKISISIALDRWNELIEENADGTCKLDQLRHGFRTLSERDEAELALNAARHVPNSYTDRWQQRVHSDWNPSMHEAGPAFEITVEKNLGQGIIKRLKNARVNYSYQAEDNNSTCKITVTSAEMQSFLNRQAANRDDGSVPSGPLSTSVLPSPRPVAGYSV